MVHSSVLAWGNGVEIDDASYLMFAIFYVGDCILMQNRRASDGKIDGCRQFAVQWAKLQ